MISGMCGDMVMDTLLLPEEDVRKLVSMDEAISVVESAFRDKALGNIQMPPKVYLFYGSGDLRVMPCYIKTGEISSVKIVNSHPRNPEKGLPTVMAMIVLVDPETGFPRAVMGGTWITGIRTGAAGAVAVKYLARKNSRIMAFIGAGMQARMQFLGLTRVLQSIREMRVFDIRSEAAEAFMGFVEGHGVAGFSLISASSAREAVEGADIIVTTTPSRKPVVMSEWISEGAHFNCIGADAPGKQELDPTILRRASKIVVDDIEQAIHSGEINVPLSEGIIGASSIYGELGEIIAGLKKGRESDNEITIFSSTGLAIQDAAVANIVYENAVKRGAGTRISLVM
jgi:alanine dehydrogenase